MKFICMLMLLLFSSIDVSLAVTVTIDGIIYDINTNTKTATVRPQYKSSPYKGDIVIPGTIMYENNQGKYSIKVVGINNKAFYEIRTLALSYE